MAIRESVRGHIVESLVFRDSTDDLPGFVSRKPTMV